MKKLIPASFEISRSEAARSVTIIRVSSRAVAFPECYRPLSPT